MTVRYISLFWQEKDMNIPERMSYCYLLTKQHKINLIKQKTKHMLHVGIFITATVVSKPFYHGFLTVETRTVFYISISKVTRLLQKDKRLGQYCHNCCKYTYKHTSYLILNLYTNIVAMISRKTFLFVFPWC